ncbi:MAG TPA: hypothetical protein VJQ56_09910, partial [Blastocatellia bacterium]|nr:hypothetical protein [Blastocatellia bacterium]
VRAEREVAADRFAVDALPVSSVGNAVEYAALLVSVARRSHGGAYRWKFGIVATEAGGRTNFEYRVRQLLRPESKLTPLRILLATAAMLLCICGAAFVPVTARPLKIALLPGEAFQTAHREITKGGVIAAGQVQPDGRERRGETQITTGVGQQSMTASFSQEGKAGGDLLEAHPNAQTEPEHEKSIAQDPIHELAALGYPDLSPDQAAAVKTYGVSPSYVKELASIGYRNLTADALINFRSLGVNPAYIREVTELGYGGLPANTIIDFRLYGVNSAYIGEMAASGFSNIPAKTLIAFRRSGINAEYVRQIRSAVAGSVLADELLALRKSGVTASFIKELKAKGHERLTVNQLIEMRSGNIAERGS